jgi:lipopolysaccharide/colanic/teichoic acid biosynthesis glycosyltransferase
MAKIRVGSPDILSMRWALERARAYISGAIIGGMFILFASMLYLRSEGAWITFVVGIFGCIWSIRRRAISLLHDGKLSLLRWQRSRIRVESISAQINFDGPTTNQQTPDRHARIYGTVKRIVDIIVSVSLLFYLAPLCVCLAVLIKLDSRGPVFYRQQRVGQHGRVFCLLRFRSMHVDAEGEGHPQWAAERDPRITRVGRLIRPLRLDEVLALFNVLKGDMSIVGPRAERPFLVEQLRDIIPFYDCRHYVRPGIVGWAQVNYPYGVSIEDAKERLAFDLFYVKHCSLALDVLILAQAILDLLIGPKHLMAQFLVRRYGAAADFEAAKRINITQSRGDGRGESAWTRIRDVITRIQVPPPEAMP